jgi:glucose-1-phosphate cytidylyltransferase
MKVVLLAGGFGTRISEESQFKPKPMIEIGGMPILWHIMKWYSHFGHKEFIICAGYKQQVIKDFFANYYLYNSDITFDFSNSGKVCVHSDHTEDWKVTVVDTGLDSLTGLRIKKIKRFLDPDEPFLMTYGDGVSDVDINQSIEFHKKSGTLATLTGVLPEGRFGVMDMEGDKITSFREKSKNDMGWINGGFMVMDPKVTDYIQGNVMLEREPLERLAAEGQLSCYRHYGFWQCMDTMRDKEKLEKLWAEGKAPWKVW